MDNDKKFFAASLPLSEGEGVGGEVRSYVKNRSRRTSWLRQNRFNRTTIKSDVQGL